VAKRGADGAMSVEKRLVQALPDELKAVIEEMR
jgi:hypothetical protein